MLKGGFTCCSLVTPIKKKIELEYSGFSNISWLVSIQADGMLIQSEPK